jgi:tripartite-type tricarboxylate transporter receptor subunit TctC
VQALIAGGQLRALCLSVLKRSASLPDVPTCAELGFAGFDVADMLGLQTSAGVSPNIVRHLQSATAKILREPEIVERMTTLGIVLEENGTADYARFMRDDRDRYEAVVKNLHLEIR